MYEAAEQKQVTCIFPLISDFTGMNAVDPRTSRREICRYCTSCHSVGIYIEVFNTITCIPKNGTISLQARRKDCVGMSSPSDTGRNLCFASENQVIVQ